MTIKIVPYQELLHEEENMRTSQSNSISKLVTTSIMLIVILLLLCFGMVATPIVHAQGPVTPTPSPQDLPSTADPFVTQGIAAPTVINGPPGPPPNTELSRAPVPLWRMSSSGTVKTLSVPTYNWVMGCSAVSAAMIAGYYDRNSYYKMYTGPANGGVAPLDNSVWEKWTDKSGTSYPNLPLAASRQWVDGRTTRGSIDDYWIQYSSSDKDPYITGRWPQHLWGDAIGDYMKTSQSVYSLPDGATRFYSSGSSSPLTCSQMAMWSIRDDGTYGRKLFYEARGYSVAECYNQATDNRVRGGFSFAQYKAEIDAGRPVMLNLTGHTIVGTGYDSANNTVYLHDTWDYQAHSMTWGSSYAGLGLQSVSIVNLKPIVFKNGVSTIWQDQNWGRINLTVCANNLKGNTVNVLFGRAGKPDFGVPPQTATSNCVTFWNMDGSGPALRNTTYYSRAALNQKPDPNWPIPCAVATGGQGLCDKISRGANDVQADDSVMSDLTLD